MTILRVLFIPLPFDPMAIEALGTISESDNKQGLNLGIQKLAELDNKHTLSIASLFAKTKESLNKLHDQVKDVPEGNIQDTETNIQDTEGSIQDTEEFLEEILQKNPTLAEQINELKKQNNLKIGKNGIELDFRFAYSLGDSDVDINDYTVIITKNGVKVVGELQIEGILNDIKYKEPQELTAMLNKMKDAIIKNEGPRFLEKYGDKFPKQLQTITTVFQKLFLDK